MLKKLVLVAAILALTIFVGAAQEKVRVFLTDSQSWEVKGGAGASDSVGAAHFNGGARPQNAEIAKTFGERCPQLTVTINRERANYIVTLDHEGGKGPAARDNKWVAYGRDGDMIGSGSTRSLGNAIKDVCWVITKDSGI